MIITLFSRSIYLHSFLGFLQASLIILKIAEILSVFGLIFMSSSESLILTCDFSISLNASSTSF